MAKRKLRRREPEPRRGGTTTLAPKAKPVPAAPKDTATKGDTAKGERR